MASTREAVLSSYRTLYRLTKLLPSSSSSSSVSELQSAYRSNIDASTNVSELVDRANKKIAYLRIITPKKRSTDGVTRWIYTSRGKTPYDPKANTNSVQSRVVSNWDGSNMDPCSVSRHKQQLRRAGFVNNLHAKGIF